MDADPAPSPGCHCDLPVSSYLGNSQKDASRWVASSEGDPTRFAVLGEENTVFIFPQLLMVKKCTENVQKCTEKLKERYSEYLDTGCFFSHHLPCALAVSGQCAQSFQPWSRTSRVGILMAHFTGENTEAQVDGVTHAVPPSPAPVWSYEVYPEHPDPQGCSFELFFLCYSHETLKSPL